MDFFKCILLFSALIVSSISVQLDHVPSTMSTIWCYQCVSTHPGCGEPFNWLWYWSQPCPEKGDKCVKITERKGGNEIITRDCLSSIRAGYRTDIPADQYEGCQPAARDVHLGNYVNSSIKEIDIRRDYYDSIEFCFCYFDNRCNAATPLYAVPVLLLAIASYWIHAVL